MSIVRLHVVVEGQTEEGFVRRVLAPELAPFGVFVDAHRITTGRRHGHAHRGGFVSYGHLARDILLWMKQDDAEESWFTTMVDLYRLPDDFPGRQGVVALPFRDRVRRLEEALAKDVARQLDARPVSRRLIPYIQLHEFEALLFSDPSAFEEAFPGNRTIVDGIAAIRAAFATPEEIDEGPVTAPSKRIAALARDYEKPVAGLIIAERIGLAAMRAACPHFDGWIQGLLALGSPYEPVSGDGTSRRQS